MAQFVLSVDLEIQKILGLEEIKTQLSSVTSSASIGISAQGATQTASALNTASAAAVATSKSFADFGVISNKSEVELDNLIKTLGLSGGAFKPPADAAKSFGDQIFLAGKRYAAFVASTAVAFVAIRSLKDATQAAIEFESAIVRLDQILDEGSARIDVLRQKFLELSTATGTSAADITEVATILAQAGLGNAIDAALEPLSKVPLLPAFRDMKQTTEGLIAVFKQFGLQGSDTSDILDLLNEAANKFAVTSEDIIEGIKRGGSAFSATGGTLKEFIQLFTTIRQVTQLSAETVGTAIKTLSGRIFQPTVFQFLQKEGVTVIDNLTGKFVGLNNVLVQIAQRFQTLTLPRQEEFARQLGGIRNIGQVFAALKNPQLLEEVGLALQNATGSAAKDAAKAMETTAVQIRLLAAEANKLVQTLAPDLFLPFVKGLVKFGEAAVFVVGALTPLIPLITTIGGLIAARGLAGIGATLISKIPGGTGLGGGVLGPTLNTGLFGPIGGAVAVGGGIRGLGGAAQNALTQNPILGIASTAVLGTLTADLLKTQTAVDLLGKETSKTVGNIIQFSTALIAGIALLRGQSITQTVKGFGLLGGIGLGIAVAGAAHANALNETIDALLNEAVESIRKINFPSLNFGGKGLDKVQRQIGALSEAFVTSAGFQKIEEFDIGKAKDGIDTIISVTDNALSIAQSFLSLDITPLKEAFAGRTVGDTRRIAAIKQFVEANLGQLTTLFDAAIKENVGNARNAFVAGLQKNTGVSPEKAQNIADELEKQLGGKEVVNARIEKGKQTAAEEIITKNLQRLQRDFESIVIPSSLTGDLIQFSKAVGLITRQIDVSAAQFNTQIATTQGIGQGNIGVQPNKQEVLDLFKTGGLDFLFKNQPNIPKFVNGLTEIEDAFNQFTIRISNLNLKELKSSDLTTQIEGFFKEQLNLPPGVRDEFKAFFNDIGNSLKDAAGSTFISPDEISKKISDRLINLGIKTRDTVVDQTTKVIESIFIQIQDRVNRLATLRKIELESNILPESKTQFLIDQLRRSGVSAGLGTSQPTRGTIEQFNEQQRRLNVTFPGQGVIAPTPPESFFKGRTSGLETIVSDENIRRQLTDKILSTTGEISNLRDSLARLKISGDGGSEAFEKAKNRLLELEKGAVELQTSLEALKNSTEDAHKSAVEELTLRQNVAKEQFKSDLERRQLRGEISPETAQKSFFDFNEQQIKEREDLDKKFQTILEEDGKRRLELARIIDKNTNTQADAATLFRDAVQQFGQSVLQFTTLSQLPATSGPFGAKGIISTSNVIPTVTPEQVKSGAVTSQQALQSINDAVTKQGNDNSRAIQDLIAAWKESLQRQETTQTQQQQPITNDKLIGQLDNLNKNLQEPGNVKLTTDNSVKFDVTGLPAALVDAITPQLQEAAENIAKIVVTKALENLASKTDIDTRTALQGTVREINT